MLTGQTNGVISGVSSRVIAKGVTYQTFKVYVWSDSSQTVDIGLQDVYGNTKFSNSYNLNEGYNEIDIADLLNNNLDNVDVGFYNLFVKDNYIPVVVTESLQGFEWSDIKYILIFDENTGLMTEIPGTQVPTESRFLSLIYRYDDQNKLGKVVIYQNNNWTETDWAKEAIMSVELTFNSTYDMFNYLIKYSNYDPSYVINAFGKMAIEDVIKILSISHLFNPIGDVINYELDINNKKITMYVRIRLGFGWEEVKRIARYVLGGAIIAGSALAGATISILSDGIGTYIGVGIALGGFALGIKIMMDSSTNPKQYKESVISTAETGKQNLTSIYNDINTSLDNYHNNGEISDEAYNYLKSKVKEMYDIAIHTINELEDEINGVYKAGYDDGYKDGEKKYKDLAIAGGVGGFLLGIAIKR